MIWKKKNWTIFTLIEIIIPNEIYYWFHTKNLVKILLWERKTYLKKKIVQIVKFAFSILLVCKNNRI